LRSRLTIYVRFAFKVRVSVSVRDLCESGGTHYDGDFTPRNLNLNPRSHPNPNREFLICTYVTPYLL